MAVKNEEEKIRVNPVTGEPMVENEVPAVRSAVQSQRVQLQPTAPESPAEAAMRQQAAAQGVAVVQPKSQAQREMEAEQNLIRSRMPAAQQPAVETKPKYMIDWDSGISPRDAYNQGNLSTYDIIRDHMRWQNDNGRNYNVLDYMFSPDDDPYKSKKENDKEKKNQQMADMFEGLGNVLSSFAQFGGALAGAPAPTNLKDPAEMTERQRRLRDKTLEQRRGYNKNLFAALKQQQADDYRRDQFDLKLRQQDWKEKLEKGKMDYNKEKLDIEREYKNGMLSYRDKMAALKELDLEIKKYQAQTGRMNAATSQKRANLAEQGYTTETTDQYGNKKVVVKRPGTNVSTQNTSSSDEDWSQYEVK